MEGSFKVGRELGIGYEFGSLGVGVLFILYKKMKKCKEFNVLIGLVGDSWRKKFKKGLSSYCLFCIEFFDLDFEFSFEEEEEFGVVGNCFCFVKGDYL